MTTLLEDIILAKLESDLLIEKVKLNVLSKYSNIPHEITVSTNIITEIERQIAIINNNVFIREGKNISSPILSINSFKI